MVPFFDTISKRILSVSLSISMILLAASVFVFSIKQATAKAPDKPAPAGHFQNCYWSHVENGRAYFLDNNGVLYYKSLSNAYAR